MDIIFIDTLIKLDRLNVHTMRQKNTMEKYFLTNASLTNVSNEKQYNRYKNQILICRGKYNFFTFKSTFS